MGLHGINGVVSYLFVYKRKMNVSNVVKRIGLMTFLSALVVTTSAQPGNGGDAPASTRFDDAVGQIIVPGSWSRVENGSQDAKGKTRSVKLRSTRGEEVVVTSDELERDMHGNDLERVAMVVLEARQRVLQLLSESTSQFDVPLITNNHSSVTLRSYGFSSTRHIRSAVRVEVTRRSVRTILVLGSDSKSAPQFASWADSIFSGIR